MRRCIELTSILAGYIWIFPQEISECFGLKQTDKSFTLSAKRLPYFVIKLSSVILSTQSKHQCIILNLLKIYIHTYFPVGYGMLAGFSFYNQSSWREDTFRVVKNNCNVIEGDVLQDVLQHVEYELQIWLNFPFIGDQLDTQKQFNISF